MGVQEQTQAAPITRARTQRHGRETFAGNLQSLAATVVIAVFVITFLVQAFQIPSESMESTLLVGDYLLVDKVEYSDPGWWRSLLPYELIYRNQIVVFRYPVDPNQHFVKRVVGLPGDRIRLVHGQVYVNGQILPDGYAHKRHYDAESDFRDNFPNGRAPSPQMTRDWMREFSGFIRNNQLVVPEDEYFVLGDNRDNSLDSRFWGFVPKENIVGRPLVIYFSVGDDDRERRASANADDRIEGLTTRLSHFSASIRWSRTLRFVR